MRLGLATVQGVSEWVCRHVVGTCCPVLTESSSICKPRFCPSTWAQVPLFPPYNRNGVFLDRGSEVRVVLGASVSDVTDYRPRAGLSWVSPAPGNGQCRSQSFPPGSLAWRRGRFREGSGLSKRRRLGLPQWSPGPDVNRGREAPARGCLAKPNARCRRERTGPGARKSFDRKSPDALSARPCGREG